MASTVHVHNIRLKEILKRWALLGNQTVVLITGSGALNTNGDWYTKINGKSFTKMKHYKTAVC